MARPGAYSHYLTKLGIMVEPPPAELSRYNQPLANITLGDVASFWASQGVTIAQVQDAWVFAYNWICDIITNSEERNELLKDIEAIIDRNNGEPPSINPNPESDWWRPPGYINPNQPSGSNDPQPTRTQEPSHTHLQQETQTPASPPSSAGGGSNLEASSLPRQPPHERSTQLPVLPDSGAGSAGALPDSIAPSAEITRQLQGLDVSNNMWGLIPSTNNTVHPGGGVQPNSSGTPTVPAHVLRDEDVEMPRHLSSA